MNDVNVSYDDDLLDWANDNLGNEYDLPDNSGSEDSEESEKVEDEVQITHDPREPIQPVSRNPIPKPNPKLKQVVIRRQIMPELVGLPKIVAKSEYWGGYLARGSTKFTKHRNCHFATQT